MKYLPLIWAGLWRKPVRALLTLLSVAVAFLLFGSLHGISAGMESLINFMSPNRMRVQSRGSLMEPLPISYFEQIARLPHVSSVTSITIFPSYFQDPKNSIGAAALGGENGLATLGAEIRISKEHAEAFKRLRTGALVGVKLAEKYGWKVGDQIHLTSNMWPKRDGTSVWTFDIAGFYHIDEHPDLAQEFWLNYEYLDQERVSRNGTTNMFILRTTDVSANAKTGAAIDQLFANSPYPTITQNDRDWIRARLRQIGDINLMVNAIVGASLFTLLFLTGNTMMQSVRQRIPEFAVLKTLGFSDNSIWSLVIIESIVICLVGAALGLALATALFPSLSKAMQAPISMPFSVLLTGISVAIVAAVVSATVPAIRARRLSVVDALVRH